MNQDKSKENGQKMSIFNMENYICNIKNTRDKNGRNVKVTDQVHVPLIRLKNILMISLITRNVKRDLNFY